MSKYTLQVKFDRADRTFRFDEEISGKVVLETQAELKCRHIWLDYGWRTHGKGNRDKGKQEKLTVLSEITQFQSGGHREFPFTIKAPNGPVTYHGHIVNVDWYLTGHADIPFAPDIKKEQDFLLMASESPREIILGSTSLAKHELPLHSRSISAQPSYYPDLQPGSPPANTFKVNLQRFLTVIAYFVAGLAIVTIFHSFPWYIIVSILIAFFFITFGTPQIIKAITRSKIKIDDLRVEPSVLYIGSQVTCHLKFQPRSSVYLNKITVKLWADETAISGGGTQTTANTHRAYEKVFTRSYSETLSSQRFIDFECTLPILPNAPPTFGSGSNSIQWYVSVELKFGGWLTWDKKFPITVLPC